MRPYIYGEYNGIYIFDLSLTSVAIDRACDFARKAARGRKNILFVGTKRNAADIVEYEAKRCGAYLSTGDGLVACSPISKRFDCGSLD